MNYWDFPYAGARAPVLARNVVATSQPLAAQAGLQAMAKGGNAVDAALAAAITLTVVEPTMNGIGSDAFAIVSKNGALHGINGSGRSPKAWTRDYFSKYKSMPARGWDSVTVPGAVKTWCDLHIKFGSLPFDKLFEQAIFYARNGFHVTPITGELWQQTPEEVINQPGFKDAFFRNNSAPKIGDLFSFPDQATTLEKIAQTNGDAFYAGELADKMISHSKDHSGLLSKDDLASHRSEWVDTISIEFAGHEVHELPPNGQGIAALIGLKILEKISIGNYDVNSAESIHLQIEAMKLAFADARRFTADPDFMTVTIQALLTDEYLQSRAQQIDTNKAQVPSYGIPPDGGTVYVCCADDSGMMVSYIQSNFMGFGSGIVVPGTGISLQDRGIGFTLEEGHPNVVGPAKRPFQTIIPGFITKKGEPVFSFGLMGGSMQPQGHIQMALRLLVQKENPQAASDAPRWRLIQGKEVEIEMGMPEKVVARLRELGHDVKITKPARFGGAQIIQKLESGYLAGSDHRKDGLAVGY